MPGTRKSDHCTSQRCQQPIEKVRSITMRASLLAVCVFSALLAQGTALYCVQCVDSTGVDCTGSSHNCSSKDDACVSTLSQMILDGKTSTLFMRSCGRSSQCNATAASVNAPKMSFRSSVACCSKDNCTSVVPALPSPSKVRNNVTCRSCLEEASSCYTADTMNCTGEETKCIRFVLTKKDGSAASTTVAARGCATPNFCDPGGYKVLNGSEPIMTFDSVCTDSSIRLQHGIFLPFLVALLALYPFF
ncbi:phospholipase A2 inhibitor gamma subunit B-like [Ambystoma mexicanum]|uniref:phospholipase A2 inhibitor gamma subunit B-like n=1 Tax=Ambystoma mexicanum TaxID=8296 RepID=UPI0037E8AF88